MGSAINLPIKAELHAAPEEKMLDYPTDRETVYFRHAYTSASPPNYRINWRSEKRPDETAERLIPLVHQSPSAFSDRADDAVLAAGPDTL